MTKKTISQKYLKSILKYDPITGIFIWVSKIAKNILIGDRAGSYQSDGYIQIKIKRKRYLAHRLAFLYMTGDWPAKLTDHRNRIKDDNRWLNLRQSTRSQNCINSKKRKNSKTSKFKGVSISQDSNKWRACIKKDHKNYHLGYFTIELNAARAYNEKAIELFGEFAYLNVITK